MAKKGSFYNNGPHILPTMGESIALKNTTFSLQPRAHWLIQVRDHMEKSMICQVLPSVP